MWGWSPKLTGMPALTWLAYAQAIGTAFVSVANRWLTLAPIVEVSNMPHADTAGVRLLTDAGIALGRGFAAHLRGGYQARSFDQGGPTIGAGLGYAF